MSSDLKPEAIEKTNDPLPGLTGVVLCGGRSTRMGSDKAGLLYHDKPQRQYLFEMLASRCEMTVLSCNVAQSAAITNLPLVPDIMDDSGPLTGILSVFQKFPATALLTVPCDLPFLNPETISYLIAHRNPAKLATVFRNENEKVLEPLVTIWEPKAYPVILAYHSLGGRSPFKLLNESDIAVLEAPDNAVFRNVNTVEGYREVMSLIQANFDSC